MLSWYILPRVVKKVMILRMQRLYIVAYRKFSNFLTSLKPRKNSAWHLCMNKFFNAYLYKVKTKYAFDFHLIIV